VNLLLTVLNRIVNRAQWLALAWPEYLWRVQAAAQNRYAVALVVAVFIALMAVQAIVLADDPTANVIMRCPKWWIGCW
jgi:hypothetical protein